MFARLLLIFQFIQTVAPLLSTIYNAVRGMFPDGTAGATKMDAFKGLFMQAVAMEDELKKFLPIAESAWPMIQTMIEAIHKDFKTTAAPTAK